MNKRIIIIYMFRHAVSRKVFDEKASYGHVFTPLIESARVRTFILQANALF